MWTSVWKNSMYLWQQDCGSFLLLSRPTIFPEIPWIKGINFPVSSHWFVVTLTSHPGNEAYIMDSCYWRHDTFAELSVLPFIFCICWQAVYAISLECSALSELTYLWCCELKVTSNQFYERCSDASKRYCLWHSLQPCTIMEDIPLMWKIRSYINDANTLIRFIYHDIETGKYFRFLQSGKVMACFRYPGVEKSWNCVKISWNRSVMNASTMKVYMYRGFYILESYYCCGCSMFHKLIMHEEKMEKSWNLMVFI